MTPNFPPAPSGIDPYSDEETGKRVDHVANQIDGLGRGFLEVWKDDERKDDERNPCFASRVRFCHRTARDYLLQNEDRRRALLDLFPSLENSQPYIRLCLAEIIHGWESGPIHGHDVFWPFDIWTGPWSKILKLA